jgi:hypothetical protein
MSTESGRPEVERLVRLTCLRCQEPEECPDESQCFLVSEALPIDELLGAGWSLGEGKDDDGHNYFHPGCPAHSSRVDVFSSVAMQEARDRGDTPVHLGDEDGPFIIAERHKGAGFITVHVAGPFSYECFSIESERVELVCQELMRAKDEGGE